MKKKLLIEFYELSDSKIPLLRQKIICGHLDASRNITILSQNELIASTGQTRIGDLHIPEKIDHFNIFEGVITIYYQNGHFLEISRFFEGEPFLND